MSYLASIHQKTNISNIRLNNTTHNNPQQIAKVLNEHFSEVAAKLNNKLPPANRRDFMATEILRAMYYAHIYPHLQYCNPIWATTQATHLNCINLIHKKIIRIITKSSYLEHTAPLFKGMKILKLEDITKLSIATTMFKKQINVSLPPHEYTTQQRQRLCIPTHRLSIFCHSTFYLGPTIWNSLPSQYKNVHSIHEFKSKLKNHFRDAYLLLNS